jgi:hypothetical protein
MRLESRCVSIPVNMTPPPRASLFARTSFAEMAKHQAADSWARQVFGLLGGGMAAAVRAKSNTTQKTFLGRVS